MWTATAASNPGTSICTTRPGGRQVAANRHEGRDLTLAVLEERAVIQRSVRAVGHGTANFQHPVELGVGLLTPQLGLVEADPGTNRNGERRSQRPVGHRGILGRVVEQQAQARHRAASLLQLYFHPIQVRHDDGVARRSVRGGEDGLDLVGGHVELAEAADGLGDGNLVGGVQAVAVLLVDRHRLEQPDVVVVPQRLHREVGHLREVADRHERRHRVQSPRVICIAIEPASTSSETMGTISAGRRSVIHTMRLRFGPSSTTCIDAWWCSKGPSMTA